ncbi:MAG: hypothetical protein GX451_04660 [Acholeplasmataceae bacterium]|nr:hypothetical protein [Acholeplasmataceae bacterium]
MKNIIFKSRISTQIQFLLCVLGLMLFCTNCDSSAAVLPAAQQVAQATVFASTDQPPVVELVSASATTELLTFTIRITGFELIENAMDIPNMVCDPYFTTGEDLHITNSYRESEMPSTPGGPLTITYQYGIDAGTLEELNIHLNITLGPCGPRYEVRNFTPAPSIPLIANYSMVFTVPIE